MRALIFKDKRNIFSLAYGALRWYINYFLTGNPLPLACDLYITSKCNLKCSFCNIWRKQSHATLPLSEARGIIDNLSNLGCFYLSVSGGEPLLVDYIFDLLLYVRGSKIKYIHMVTNGYLLDSSKAKRLKETGINEVSISIDGTRQFHDEKRGAGDSYDRAVEAVENIKEYAPNTKIVLNTILWPREPFECLHVVELARLFDVYVKVQPLNQHPIFDTDNSSVISSGGISQAEIKEVVTRLRKEKRVVNSGLFLENIYNFFFEKKNLIFRDSPCIFGYHHIEISENGRVFPCLEGMNWQNGLDYKGDLMSLLRSSIYKRLLEKLKLCKGCQRNYYICYYEPRINFPIVNFLKSAFCI